MADAEAGGEGNVSDDAEGKRGWGRGGGFGGNIAQLEDVGNFIAAEGGGGATGAAHPEEGGWVVGCGCGWRYE